MTKKSSSKEILRKTYILDATNQFLGRLAVRIVTLLSGKHKSDFVPYQDKGDFVVIKNIDKLKFSGKKLKQKVYYHHSGYPGGLKKEKLESLFQRRPVEVLRKAVLGMLPKNKLRAQRIKRLSIK